MEEARVSGAVMLIPAGSLFGRSKTMRFLFKIILLGLAATTLMGRGVTAAEMPVRILALGDSLTQGYGLPPGTDYPAELQRALKTQGINVVIVNGGVSGDTSAGGLARLDWSIADPQGVPDAAIVELGINDGLRGLPVVEMEKNLDAILAKLNARHIAVLFAGMKGPRNFGARYAAEFDAVFPRLAKKYGLLFYPFFLEGVALEPSLVQADGLHPNQAGVQAIVKRLVPIAVRLVQQARMH
jgi:acyl-CoA thioesterase-1